MGYENHWCPLLHLIVFFLERFVRPSKPLPLLECPSRVVAGFDVLLPLFWTTLLFFGAEAGFSISPLSSRFFSSLVLKVAGVLRPRLSVLHGSHF